MYFASPQYPTFLALLFILSCSKHYVYYNKKPFFLIIFLINKLILTAKHQTDKIIAMGFHKHRNTEDH